MARNNVEVQFLSIDHLNMLQQEFEEEYNILMESSHKTLKSSMILKLEAIKSCNR